MGETANEDLPPDPSAEDVDAIEGHLVSRMRDVTDEEEELPQDPPELRQLTRDGGTDARPVA